MRYLMLLFVALSAAPLAAQDSGGTPADTARKTRFHFDVRTNFSFRFAYAFDPDSILQARRRLALSRAQSAAVTAATRQAMERFAGLRDRLQERQAELDRLLAAPQVDETAATAALDEVMHLENTIKRLRLTLLIRSKNTLKLDQQQLRWQFGRNEP